MRGNRFGVVICGGGVAGVEGLLRLHRLAGDAVEVTLLSPAEHLVYRPLAVLEPFAFGPARRYPIERIVADTRARWVRDALGWVDWAGRTVHTDDGQQLRYDALLLAVGGRKRAPFEHVDVFTGDSADQTFHRTVQQIEAGELASIAFVLSEGPSWPLPLYELALLTAQRARAKNRPLEISFITPEARPLHAFGGEAGDAVERLLQDAGITLYTGATVRVPGPGHVVLQPGGIELHPERTVTLPSISGPNIRGIPGDAVDRFLSVDEYCHVRDTDGRVFAAGDATNLPIKHGGLGTQQADVAAAGIAHLAGAAGRPAALRLVIHGMLLTGHQPLYLAAHLAAGQGWRTKIYSKPPWTPDEKLIAEELGPYLRGLDPAAIPGPAPD
jgi:sulfide:quinone oxidoreductase